MDNNIVVSEKFNFTPRTLEEAIKFAEILSKSDLVPREYQGKPANIVVAIQMGAEVGISPLQSLSGIKNINGKPSLYGDAALAVVKQHPSYENHQEYTQNGVGICRIKRKGHDWHEVKFDIDQAKKAGLWGKSGPWTQYPDVMLRKRARGFALRDMFPDALVGLITVEEAEDYPVNYSNGKTKVFKEEVQDVSEGIELISEEHIITLRELMIESHTEEELLVSTMSPKFNVIHDGEEMLENFPDSSFQDLEGKLKKKIQLNKELDDKRNLLNAG